MKLFIGGKYPAGLWPKASNLNEIRRIFRKAK